MNERGCRTVPAHDIATWGPGVPQHGGHRSRSGSRGGIEPEYRCQDTRTVHALCGRQVIAAQRVVDKLAHRRTLRIQRADQLGGSAQGNRCHAAIAAAPPPPKGSTHRNRRTPTKRYVPVTVSSSIRKPSKTVPGEHSVARFSGRCTKIKLSGKIPGTTPRPAVKLMLSFRERPDSKYF